MPASSPSRTFRGSEGGAGASASSLRGAQATKQSRVVGGTLDCVASLAMTAQRVVLIPSHPTPQTHVSSPAARCARVLRPTRPSKTVERARGMPGEGLTHGPPAEKKAGGSHHRFSRSSGIPRALVLTLIRARPGDRLDCPRPREAKLHRVATTLARCARPQHREARPTRFHVRIAVVRRHGFD